MSEVVSTTSDAEMLEVKKENKKLRIALVNQSVTMNEIINCVKEHGHAEDILSQQLGDLLNIANELPERQLYTDSDTVN